MTILFLVSAHNGLSQRAQIALTELGHRVEVAVVEDGAAMEAAVEEHGPDLIVCPMLKTYIPESVFSRHRCLVVHPGPVGDRGPSSLDWAIELGMAEWGVTVLEANAEMDGGDVYGTRTFAMREAGKSSLYRHEVRRAAIEALLEAIARIEPLDTSGAVVTERPVVRQEQRAIDWAVDSTEAVMRKLRAAEGHPGVRDVIGGEEFHLFGAHRERGLRGRAGEIIATRHGAICRATVDGAVWITHLKRDFKLPATRALERVGVRVDAPEVDVPVHAPIPDGHTWREIAYTEANGVGYLRFAFYNGAMSTAQCRRLLEAYRYARTRATDVIVLEGGDDFFSNGIHLNVIEAAADPADESWHNLNAIDDVVREVLETDSHLVVAALHGDAAAGGVPFAMAADHVIAREDVVLNPYYQHMGGLYGSEYWTYLMPRRLGHEVTAELTSAPFRAIGARRAVDIGMVDWTFTDRAQTRIFAERLTGAPDALEAKRAARARDEARKPLADYRSEELARSYECFHGPDRSYHEARRRFVYKTGAPCTADALETLRAAVDRRAPTGA